MIINLENKTSAAAGHTTACLPEQRAMTRQRITTLLLLQLAAAASASAAIRVSRADALSDSALQNLNRRQRGSGASASDDTAWTAALRAANERNSANCFYALSGGPVGSCKFSARAAAGLAHGDFEDDTIPLLIGCKQATATPCIRVSQVSATLCKATLRVPCFHLQSTRWPQHHPNLCPRAAIAAF